MKNASSVRASSKPRANSSNHLPVTGDRRYIIGKIIGSLTGANAAKKAAAAQEKALQEQTKMAQDQAQEAARQAAVTQQQAAAREAATQAVEAQSEQDAQAVKPAEVDLGTTEAESTRRKRGRFNVDSGASMASLSI